MKYQLVTAKNQYLVIVDQGEAYHYFNTKLAAISFIKRMTGV